MAHDVDPCRVWLPEVLQRVAERLPANFVACSLRLTDRRSAEALQAYTSVDVSQAVPVDAFRAHWSAPHACNGLTFQRRRQLITLTAGTNVLSNVEVAVAAAGVPFHAESAISAAGKGALESCAYLTAQPGMRLRRVDWRNLLIAAATGGHRHVCTWALEVGNGYITAEWTPKAVQAAAKGGHLELAAELAKARPETPRDARDVVHPGLVMFSAVQGCDTPTLQRLCEDFEAGRGIVGVKAADCHPIFQPPSSVHLLEAVVIGPTPDWAAKAAFVEARGCAVRTNDVELYSDVLQLPYDEAVHRMEWLAERGWRPSRWLLRTALESKNMAAVLWIVRKGERGASGFEFARIAGSDSRLDAVQQLYDMGCMTDPKELAETAALGGALATLQWAHATWGPQRIGLGPELFQRAAASGDVRVMRWLRLEAGCGWSAAAWEYAAMAGCGAALEWLAQEGCPMPTDGLAYAAAARPGDLPTLRLLRRLGVPLGGPEALAEAVWSRDDEEGGCPEGLAWLLEQGHPVDWKGVGDAMYSWDKWCSDVFDFRFQDSEDELETERLEEEDEDGQLDRARQLDAWIQAHRPQKPRRQRGSGASGGGSGRATGPLAEAQQGDGAWLLAGHPLEGLQGAAVGGGRGGGGWRHWLAWAWERWVGR
ncbi:hypothetical protein HYH03_001905 [Edaphochlamys debaryana]|uniref:Ankyrin repeat domain-containing protein n=1 Tax=Edaphochlamys debaryana TaxID=47281 RepID=A0A835YMD0_9CHLO|nr:hypothetical protein HYH03_001905 [Edaphochlamys debaryana]|eukprot:KAG2500329.1 hypothetical protein HYH03_001905 [Edaphochlamys debaryana]